MSAANVQGAVLANAGICPQCGNNLVVPSECGYCRWSDSRLAPKNPDGGDLGSWSRRRMIIFLIISLFAPMFGVWAGYVGTTDNRTREQGRFLIGFSIAVGFFIIPLILKLIRAI